ncbi:pyruvate dehydrogenase protein X component, mitochondrial-like [Uloborus diversus]|uniref:pyruvate dehydrogenase protein X component, mitochondrial-like n=1 Tax=Uloborus diversus TaxID=327109 RepID=UPI00240A21B8|nr:pyruvate dehydrogenase protein X component, mitochondrial-like [Uloborus diversus]
MQMASLQRCIFLSTLCRRIFVPRAGTLMAPGNAFIHYTRNILDSCKIEIKMPSLSPTMTEGTIVKWLKKEGDSISPGDVLCEIQTDKAIVGLETEEEGVLIKILVPEDTKNVPLGELIAIIEGEGSADNTGVSEDITHSSPQEIAVKKEPALTNSSVDSSKLIGPSVRKLLQDYGIKYSLITGSGPHNILLKGDVLNYIKDKNIKQKSFESELPKTPDVTFIEKQQYVDIPVTSMRKTIARRLTESKTSIPHAYASVDCKIDNILKFRKQLKDDGISVSMNDFVIKSAASALSQMPSVNVINVNDTPKSMQSVDISIAVATESGLITPIVKDADKLNLEAISSQVKSLAVKAREGKLKPEEFQGGSFTISNLGMFGISEFSAVINPPQGAILAVGSSKIVFEDFEPRQKIRVTLSYDSRMIDESEAGKFLNRFRINMENPTNILL